MTERALSLTMGLSNLNLATALAGLILKLRVPLFGGLMVWVASLIAVGQIDQRIMVRQRRERQESGD